jgi:hypothetical protein
MSSFSSNHSNSRKRSADTEDEAPRAKLPRSAFTSFESAALPSSLPLLPLSTSLPEMHSHVDNQGSGLRLPFSLSNLAPEKSHGRRTHIFKDVGDIEITVKKPKNGPLDFNIAPSTSPCDWEEAVAPVQTEFKGPINLLDARTGQITMTRDPRGGFGYDPDANFTPESSFGSFGSVNPVVKLPMSSTGLGPINLIDAHSGKIVTTRDPRGGFGYDPDTNFTPNSSFNSVQTAVLPSRKFVDPNKRPLYGVSLFGPPRKKEEDDGDEDDSKTLVGDPQDVANKEELLSFSQTSFSVSNIIEPNSSFDDVLVCRQNGDTSFTSPSTKPCSAAANMIDITTAEYHAEKLLKERPDSDTICETMCSRLERMVNAKIASAKKEAKAKKQKVVVPKPVEAAVQLHAYLLEQKEKRLEMGELNEIVELEIQWADWLVEVTQTGVMHLKVHGCTCRPELMTWE